MKAGDWHEKEQFMGLVADTLYRNPDWAGEAVARAVAAATSGLQAQLVDARQGLWAAMALCNQKRLTADMVDRLNQIAKAALRRSDDTGGRDELPVPDGVPRPN